ncbi:MAG: cation:proton antiporter [bacterium]
MQNMDLILTLTGGLAAALVLGYLMNRLKVSAIAGYLIAGIVVGPHTPGFIANRELASQMADIGIILLMFGVGLQFNFKKLAGVTRLVVPGALLQSLITTVLGTLVALAFGLGLKTGVVYGLALSVASTVAMIRVFSDARRLHTPAGNRATGWLVMEDLFMVFVLILLPAVLGEGQRSAMDLIRVTGLAIFKIVAVIAAAFLLGGRVIPWILRHVAATRSRELFTLTILVTALGIAVGASVLFGISMALGALMAGMVVGRSDFSLRAATEALPMRDAFSVLFFVSVGMLFEPARLFDTPTFGIATLALVLVGKPLVAGALMIILGCPTRNALTLSLALAQIGEFSFILAGVGSRLGLLDVGTGNLLVVASIISLILNPFLLRLADPVEAWLVRHPRLWRRLNRIEGSVQEAESDRDGGRGTADRHRAVLVGYGPVGRTLADLLREQAIETTVVEMNHETIQRLKARSINVVYGDASHAEVLKAAGTHQAGTLILSAPDIPTAADIIRQARAMNPEIRILVNTSYLSECPVLETAGADEVFSGEAEVASAMCISVLRRLGANPDEIHRVGVRVRSALDTSCAK